MEQRVFVAREPELAQLYRLLGQALAGQGQVCFVTGEAGSGKTSLVTEFTRRILLGHQELVVAIGQSDAQTGAGDPYLPFREILGQLTGDVEAKLDLGAFNQDNAGRLRKLLGYSGQALVEIGPDLIGVFVPGVGLATRAATFLAEKAGWLDKIDDLTKRPASLEELASSGIQQSHIFEQYTNVLKKLAGERALVLVLDDLQWADAASIGLLFRVGRRIENSRILLIGTLRPEEVALGRAGERHPLEKVLSEFKRYYGDVLVDLDEARQDEGWQFLEALLDTEPNRLGSSFRQALYHHTDGHPLFTVELLRDMQERGDLAHDPDGYWVEGPLLNWDALPDRVEGVIEERLSRLESELKQALAIGSIQGEDFTAEVVARVQQVDGRRLVGRLSTEVQKQHRLVQAHGVQRIDGNRLSGYRFQHNLFQRFLYGELDEIQRSYLHEDVGNVLEALYGEHTDEVAVQLGRHFEEAGLAEKAAHYLRRAGQLAALRFANEEALGYFTRALTFIPESKIQERVDCLLEREQVYDLLGVREAQLKDLEELAALAESLSGEVAKVPVLMRKGSYLVAIDDYPAAQDIAQQVIAIGQSGQDLYSVASGYHLLGVALSLTDDGQEALQKLDQALQIWRELGNSRKEGLTLNSLGGIADSLGDYSQAKSYYGQALAIAREGGDRLSECKVLNNLGLIASHEGDFALTRDYYQQSLAILRQIGFRKGEGVLLQNLGVLDARTGDFANARSHFEQALAISQQVGDRYSEARLLLNLGCAAGEQSDFVAARSYLERALSMARDLGIHIVADALGNLGELLKETGEFDRSRVCFEEALIIARQTQVRDIEAWISSSLGELLGAQAEYDQAMERVRAAVAICREIGEPSREASALHALGDLHTQLGALVSAREHLEQSLGLYQAVEEPRGIGRVQASLGLLALYSGDHRAALDASDVALSYAQDLGDRSSEASANMLRGYALEALGKIEASRAAYENAMTNWQDLGQHQLAVEAKAGLASVALGHQRLSEARPHVQEILSFLEERPLDGTADRFWIYLTCYRVLEASGDSLAQRLLGQAYDILQKQAQEISDKDLRSSFLTQVPSNRELRERFESFSAMGEQQA